MNRLTLLLLTLSSITLAQGRRENPPLQPATPPAPPAATAPRGPAPEEKTSVTHHQARIGSQTISYTATAGNYVIKADDGTPKASFFFVSYTKDDVGDVSKRPISFVYNGGPGPYA